MPSIISKSKKVYFPIDESEGLFSHEIYTLLRKLLMKKMTPTIDSFNMFDEWFSTRYLFINIIF